MVNMSKRAIALCATITLVLVAAADLAQGRHTDGARDGAPARQSVFGPRSATAVPTITNAEFDARWSDRPS